MKKDTILVTGLHGFIGSRLVDVVGSEYDLLDLNRRGVKYRAGNVKKCIKADIVSKKDISKAISQFTGTVVLHLAAKAHIDKCEKDRKLARGGEAWKVNADGTKNIAEACSENGKFLIYLSSECVFDGEKEFYNELDTPNPINWYGVTKLFGEKEIIESGCRFCILRSVFAYGHPKSTSCDIFRVFYNKFLSGKSFKAVFDQKIAFTFIDDLVNVILILAREKTEGLYHYAGSREYAPYEFAKKVETIFDIANSRMDSVSILDFFGEKRAKLRLKHASLSSAKVKKAFGISSSDLDDVLPVLVERTKA